MKKLMFALFALMISFTVVNAQQQQPGGTEETAPAIQQDDKVKIKPDELPEQVRESLNSNDYDGWEVSTAYRHTDKEVYEVELKKGMEMKTVKFDKEGNKIEE